MKRSLNILHTVEFYSPSLGGSQEAVKQLSERLVERGHHVTVATSARKDRDFTELNGVEVKGYDVTGNYVWGMKGEVDRYRREIASWDNDIMLNYAAQVWPTDALVTSLSQLPTYNVLVPVGFSNLRNHRYYEYFTRMKHWLKLYDACVYLSSTYRDIEFARSCEAGNSTIIPNGADEREFDQVRDIDIRKRLSIPDDHFLIVLVGTHSGVKGHHDAIKIFNRADIGRATLLIIANDQGRGCGKKCRLLKRVFDYDPRPRIAKKYLILADLSRKETVAAYQQADLFLFPSNIECSPIVLFEAMAGGTPFMTTDVGNTIEIVDWSGGGVIMPTTKDERGFSHAEIGPSARLLEELYNDPDRRRRLGRSGKEAWRERFTWERVAERYEKLYFSLVDGTFKGEVEELRAANRSRAGVRFYRENVIA